MAQKSEPKLITRVAPKKVLEQNVEALKSYEHYKQMSDIIDRANIALGRKPAFVAGTGSTLNFEVDRYGVASTTA